MQKEVSPRGSNGLSECHFEKRSLLYNRNDFSYQKCIYTEQLKALTFLNNMAVVYYQADLFAGKMCGKWWQWFLFFKLINP